MVMSSIIVDHLGRPIQSSELKRPDTRPVTTASVRDRWSTYPSAGLTPVKLANILKAADNGDVRSQAELFEEMEEKDAHIASLFQTRKLAVVGLPWEITPASDDPRDVKVADFCREWMESLEDFDDYILDLLDALPKGYSAMEVDWDVSEGQAIITQLRHIHAKKITFWNSMTPRVLTEDSPIQGVEPPHFKMVYHRYKARSGYDTRAGIMRVCAWMYLFKNYDIKDWVSFSEVFGQPIRIGKHAPGATEDEKDKLLEAVRAIGADAAAIISRNTEIEFVEGQKYGSVSLYEKLAKFCDDQNSKAILGQTLTSGTGEVGSQALGTVHDGVRQDLKEADGSSVSKTVRHGMLRPLVGFNFGWDIPIPGFRFLVEPPEDTKAVAETHKILSEMGLDFSQEYASKRFNIPLRAKDETPLNRPGQQTQIPMKRLALSNRLESQPMLPQDMIAGRALELVNTADLVDMVKRELTAATSMEDFRDRIINVYGELPELELVQVLQKALVLADLAGRFDASA
jgi:Mu-like prophage protein gp29